MLSVDSIICKIKVIIPASGKGFALDMISLRSPFGGEKNGWKVPGETYARVPHFLKDNCSFTFQTRGSVSVTH